MHMCADCPELEKEMAAATGGPSHGEEESFDAKLCCGNCGITLAAVKTGAGLGCSDCYRVFGDLITKELLAQNRISKKWMLQVKGTNPIHVGKSLKEAPTYSPAVRLLALNEALSEMLSREDYEQAAVLRDQIKQLVEEQGNERAT